MTTNSYNFFFVAFILVLTCTQSAQSQSSWSEGYYISLEGDTIRGKIEEKKWREQPNEFRFKPSNAKKEILLTTSNTHIIQTEKGNFYLNAQINYLEYSSSADKVTIYPPNKQSQTVFLQRLVGGHYALYLFIRSDGTKLFFMGQGDSAVEYLTYYKILRNDNKISEIKLFLKQVEHFTMNCPAVVSCYAETNYNENDLEILFINANNCKNGNKDITIKQKNDDEKFKLGVTLGGNSTQLFFQKFTEPSIFPNVSFEKSTSLYLGIESLVKFHKLFRHFSLQNELSFSGYHAAGSYSANNQVESQEYKLIYFRHNLMIRYAIPVKPFSPYIQAGAVNGLVVRNWNKKVITYKDSFSESRQELPAIDAVNALSSGWAFGAGLEWKKWYMETRFEKAVAFKTNSWTNSLIVKLGYWFWHK